MTQYLQKVHPAILRRVSPGVGSPELKQASVFCLLMFILLWVLVCLFFSMDMPSLWAMAAASLGSACPSDSTSQWECSVVAFSPVCLAWATSTTFTACASTSSSRWWPVYFSHFPQSLLERNTNQWNWPSTNNPTHCCRWRMAWCRRPAGPA